MNLAKLAEFGIKATVTPTGKLHLEAPKGRISPDLRDEIAKNRDSLLAEVNIVNIKSTCMASPARQVHPSSEVHRPEKAVLGEGCEHGELQILLHGFASAPSVGLGNVHRLPANDSAPDSRGQWTWPSGDGWSDGEIDAFLARTARWTPWLGETQAESLAEVLLHRDRDPQDNRRLCLECRFCISGRCANSVKAGFVRGSTLGDMALVLQRCEGYWAGGGSLALVAPAATPAKRARTGHPLTDSTRQEAIQYHAHHFGCSQCIAAGRSTQYNGRCAVGLALWSTYTEADDLQTEGGHHEQA